MLSRHGSFQPVARLIKPRGNARSLPSPNADRESSAFSAASTIRTDDLELCARCGDGAFGSNATGGAANGWTSAVEECATRAGCDGSKKTVAFTYVCTVRDLYVSAVEEGCRWCGVVVNSIVQAERLDRAMQELEQYNSDEDESDEGEEDSPRGDGVDQEDDECDRVEESDDEVGSERAARSSERGDESAILDEEEQNIGFPSPFLDEIAGTSFGRGSTGTEADQTLEKFDRCDITVSYVREDTGGQSGFNILEAAIDVHVADPVDACLAMVGENAVHVSGRVFATPEDPAATFISTRPCELDLGSNSSFKQAEEWLAACRTHEACSRTPPGGGTSFIPTRLVDISDPKKPRLLVPPSGSGHFEYAALSYTWGTDQPCSTTVETIDEKIRGLDVRRLPQTIVDAMTVCEKLGIMYLWVDSLCIVQNSKQDKVQEIARMRNIYRWATLTIAAAKAETVNDGFLSRAKPRYFLDPFQIPFRYSGAKPGRAWFSVPEFYLPRNDQWNSRAWTLEEQLLSSRLLIYSYDGFKWLCKTALWETINPLNHPRPYLELPLVSEMSHKSAGNEEQLQIDLREHWYDILAEYTERSVTHERDKLVAFAAISEEFHLLWGGRFLSGLWEQFLFEDLLWHRDITSTFQPWFALFPRPQKYRAPSWSWASVEGKTFGPYGDRQRRDPFHFKILDCSVDLESDALPFGAVTAGYLKVDGLLRTGYWCQSSDEDLCDGFITRLPGDSKAKAVTQVSVDAKEEGLIPGALVFCLPLAQITHSSATMYPIEGLVLLAAEHGHFRRVGFFSECRAFAWVNGFQAHELTIV